MGVRSRQSLLLVDDWQELRAANLDRLELQRDVILRVCGCGAAEVFFRDVSRSSVVGCGVVGGGRRACSPRRTGKKSFRRAGTPGPAPWQAGRPAGARWHFVSDRVLGGTTTGSALCLSLANLEHLHVLSELVPEMLRELVDIFGELSVGGRQRGVDGGGEEGF